MLDLDYVVFRSFNLMNSDPYDDERVKNFDRMLHRALSEIFKESLLTSDQIKQLLCISKKCTDKHPMIQSIVRKEPALGQQLLKKCKLSLLWIAVMNCYQESAELLVRSGADVNELYGLEDSPTELLKNSTILHALIQMYPSKWNDRLIKLVIDYGADLKARDEDNVGYNALELAIEYNRVKVAEMLLEKGADANAVNDDGLTPVHQIIHTKLADELLPVLVEYGADVHAKDPEGKNALHHLTSAPLEYVDLARVLIEMGVSLDDRTKRGHVLPIHLAVFGGYNELVNLFLDYGVNVNSRMMYGITPLKLAIQGDDPEVLLTLLKRGANIDAKDTHGRTALHFACQKSKVEKIKILLSVGADMFVADGCGQTPFEIVCSQNSMDHPNTRPLLNMLALTQTCSLQPSTECNNEKIMETYPLHWTYYQHYYQTNISLLTSIRFIENCTLFDLLTKCQCQIAVLMQNNEFENQLNMLDDKVFSMFDKEIVDAFERVKGYYRTILDFEDDISDTVSKCETCEMKKIVQASRKAP